MGIEEGEYLLISGKVRFYTEYAWMILKTFVLEKAGYQLVQALVVDGNFSGDLDGLIKC